MTRNQQHPDRLYPTLSIDSVLGSRACSRETAASGRLIPTAVHIFKRAGGRYFTSTTRKRVRLDFACRSTPDSLACASCLYFQPLAGCKDVHSSASDPLQHVRQRVGHQLQEAECRCPRSGRTKTRLLRRPPRWAVAGQKPGSLWLRLSRTTRLPAAQR